MRALLAATGLLILTSLSSGRLIAQNLPTIPQAPATPEEAAAVRNSENTQKASKTVQSDNASMEKAEQSLLGVPTAGAVTPEPKVPVDPQFPVPEDVEDAASSALKLTEQASVLYDAKTIGFDKTGSNYNFSGDVVLIGAGYVITADDISVAYQSKVMTASGHVLIIHQNQVFSGDKITLHWESSDFVIANALLVASDPGKIREVSQSILGLTTQELEYEAAKKTRRDDLEKEREEIRENFRKSPEAKPDDLVVNRYTRLLEQDLVTEKSLAPSLAQQDVERRKRFERRRIFWEKGRAEAAKNAVPALLYFRLQGESLERKDGNTYTARDAIFTPCICADGNSPAWGFQADEIVTQQEGYINLKHPVLTIKGVPIIYLPFLKLPMKVKRQSGFLMPSFQTSSRNGFVYSQPVFLENNPNSDATLTTDLFQKRGIRLGLEARYEARSDSGFRYQFETIRDRSWLELGSYRRDLQDYFINTNSRCTQVDPIEKLTCEESIKDGISPPSNTWRGKQDWAGRYSLAPRLSLVTKGKIVSDHRYLEDLYLPEEVVTAFAPKANANAFSTSNAKANFDGKDFFIGLRSSYADNSLLTKQYSGQQIPGALDFQSRYFRIFPASWWHMPTYGEIRISTLRVDEKGLPQTITTADDLTLGSGTWNRIGFNLVTPISTDGIIKVDHFAEAELRYVEHPNLDINHSTIRSWKTGINLNLPIDGTGKLPGFLQPKNIEGARYGQHIMNWGLTFSDRPVVIREGPYGDQKDENGAPLVYRPSDRNRLFSEDQDIRDEDVMVKHERITLSTSHRWRFFDRLDQALPPAVEKVDVYDSELDNLQEQARRDLMAVKDKPVQSVDEIYRQNKSGAVDWLVRRYKTVDQNGIEPISFSAQISYDAEQERLRRRQVEENARLEDVASRNGDSIQAAAIRAQKTNYINLYESWIGPSASLGLNYKGFALDTSAFYNIYKRTSTSLAFALGLPTFYSTQFGLRYVLEKSPELDPSTDTLLFKRTKTTTVGLATQLIPMITVGANLIRKQVEGQDEPHYGTSYQIGFDDRSGCWGLRFLREKDLNQLEEDANYILQLAVIFLGNRRNVDISPGLEREIRGPRAVESN